MNWHGRASGKRGRSPTFSDEAIQFCLSIKCLFGLPLRQAMGMTQKLNANLIGAFSMRMPYGA
jgi:hypothetical protein